MRGLIVIGFVLAAATLFGLVALERMTLPDVQPSGKYAAFYRPFGPPQTIILPK